MVETEIVTTPIVFEQYNQFNTADFILFYTNYLHIIDRLSTNVIVLRLHAVYKQTIYGLYTGYKE